MKEDEKKAVLLGCFSTLLVNGLQLVVQLIIELLESNLLS